MQAKESLDVFLKKNIKLIREDTNVVNDLKKTWLEIYPKYKEAEFLLDVVWEGCRTQFWGLSDCTCSSCSPFRSDYAKSFTVKVCNYDAELDLYEKLEGIK